MSCNFFFLSVYHHNLIFTHYFCRGFFMRTHFFTAVFSAINHCFEEALAENGEEFSVIYYFVTLFANNAYFKVSLMFLISTFTVKIRNKISQNHTFYFFFPFLRNETKLMINSLTVSSCHVTYVFQSEFTLYNCLNVKELLVRSRREI